MSLIKWRWEQIDDWSSRTKVFGGWLVRIIYEETTIDHGNCHTNQNYPENIIFISDPKHEWEFVTEAQELEAERLLKNEQKEKKT